MTYDLDFKSDPSVRYIKTFVKISPTAFAFVRTNKATNKQTESVKLDAIFFFRNKTNQSLSKGTFTFSHDKKQ